MTDNELLQAIYGDVQSLKQDVHTLKQDTQALKQDVHTLKQDTQEIKQRVTDLEDNATAVRLTLENEIRVNIQRVAEGHLDLSRNFHEAMMPSNEVEMLSIKVRHLESDMTEMKRKVL